MVEFISNMWPEKWEWGLGEGGKQCQQRKKMLEKWGRESIRRRNLCCHRNHHGWCRGAAIGVVDSDRGAQAPRTTASMRLTDGCYKQWLLYFPCLCQGRSSGLPATSVCSLRKAERTLVFLLTVCSCFVLIFL